MEEQSTNISPQEPVMSPVPDVSATGKWHPTPLQKKIAAYGGVIILILLLAIGYTRYEMYANYKRVEEAALKAQSEAEALQKKRAETNPTEGWQTYRNEEVGYEISYPSTMTHKPFEKFGGAYKLNPYEVYIDDKSEPSIEGSSFNINIKLSNGDALTIYTEDHDGCEKYAINQPALLASEQIIFDGKPAWKLACTGEYGGDHVTIYVNFSVGKVLTIDYGYQDLVHEKILSTFKFIEPARVVVEVGYRPDFSGPRSIISPDGTKVAVPSDVDEMMTDNLLMPFMDEAPSVIYFVSSGNTVSTYDLSTKKYKSIYSWKSGDYIPEEYKTLIPLRSCNSGVDQSVYMTTIGREGNKIILYFHLCETGGVCDSSWLYGGTRGRLAYLDLDNIQGGIRPYTPPKDVINKHKTEEEKCMKEAGIM